MAMPRRRAVDNRDVSSSASRSCDDSSTFITNRPRGPQRLFIQQLEHRPIPHEIEFGQRGPRRVADFDLGGVQECDQCRQRVGHVPLPELGDGRRPNADIRVFQRLAHQPVGICAAKLRQRSAARPTSFDAPAAATSREQCSGSCRVPTRSLRPARPLPTDHARRGPKAIPVPIRARRQSVVGSYF